MARSGFEKPRDGMKKAGQSLGEVVPRVIEKGTCQALCNLMELGSVHPCTIATFEEILDPTCLPACLCVPIRAETAVLHPGGARNTP